MLSIRNKAELFQFTHPGKGATRLYLVSHPDHNRFNSRTLGRVRRITIHLTGLLISVSIHAPWEGCDWSLNHLRSVATCFNSRTLGRVRRRLSRIENGGTMFQFTHPGKGATELEDGLASHRVVSIHAPWEGCDSVDALEC